jgi:hypothetical protein
MVNRTNNNGHLNIDKQLSKMLLYQCAALVFSYIPYCIENIYFAKFVNRSIYPTSFNLLFHIIAIILFYVNPVASFYIFYISTPNFRHEIHKIILCKRHHHIMNNQVHTGIAVVDVTGTNTLIDPPFMSHPHPHPQTS